MHRNIEESEHYNLLLEIDLELKDIRKIFRIRTAKDKTRRTKKAELKRLSATKQTEMKQSEAVKQSSQQKFTTTELTEIVNYPSMKDSLTDKPLKTLPKTITKQKKGISKPMMNRRKIKKLLV